MMSGLPGRLFALCIPACRMGQYLALLAHPVGIGPLGSRVLVFTPGKKLHLLACMALSSASSLFATNMLLVSLLADFSSRVLAAVGVLPSRPPGSGDLQSSLSSAGLRGEFPRQCRVPAHPGAVQGQGLQAVSLHQKRPNLPLFGNASRALLPMRASRQRRSSSSK
jgi:hypothetical protein